MVKKIFFNPQFVRFLAVGGFAALVNFSSRILLSEFFSFRLAVVLAYIIGMLTAYTLSRFFVFEKSGKSALNEFYRFTLINLLAIIQVWLISVGLVEYVFPAIQFKFYEEEVGHLIGLSVPILTSFIGHKYFTFNSSNGRNGSETENYSSKRAEQGQE